MKSHSAIGSPVFRLLIISFVLSRYLLVICRIFLLLSCFLLLFGRFLCTMQTQFLSNKRWIVVNWYCLSLLNSVLANMRKLRNAVSNLFVRFVHRMSLQMPVRRVISNPVQHAAVMRQAVRVLERFNRLHLDHKVSVRGVHLLRVEDTAVGFEASACLMPAAAVERVEVIAPVELEFVQFLVVGEDLNVIVQDVPGHVRWVKTRTPGVESGGPEVHADGLCLVHEANGLGRVCGKVADLVSIDAEADVVGSPLEFVDMEIVMRVETVGVVVILELVVSVSVDHICRQWVRLGTRHDLDVELVPAAGVESRTIPISEERRDSSLFVGSPHTSHKLSVGELLVGGDRATLEVGLGDADDHQQGYCEFHFFCSARKQYSNIIII